MTDNPTGTRQRSTAPPAAPPTTEKPWAFWLVILSIQGVIFAFLVVMLVFAWVGIFKEGDAANVAAALSSLFGIVGTLVGTYFGIKSSSEARGAAEGIARVALDQSATSTEGLVSAINNLHAAWNASDEEMVAAFFADNAVLSLAPLPSGKQGTYTGKGEIRNFAHRYMPYSQVQSRNYRSEDNRVTWESTVTLERLEGAAEDLTRMATGPVEGTCTAIFEGTKIKSFAFTLSPATQSRAQDTGGQSAQET